MHITIRNILTYPIGGGLGRGLSNPFLPRSQYVFISPFPLISIGPRGSKVYPPAFSSLSRVASDKCIRHEEPNIPEVHTNKL